MTTAQHAAPVSVPAARGGCPFDPPPAYQRALREEPVSEVTLWDGGRCWMVTRHADIRSVLRDPRFSSVATHPGFPFLSPGRRELAAAARYSLIRMDDPEHARLRRMLTADFMIRRIEELRPRIQDIVDDFLDRMIAHGSPADLVAEFALPVPSLVICLLLGVDYADHGYFQDLSRTLLDNRVPPEGVARARAELLDYLGELTERKRREPDRGILSRLIAQGGMSDQEIAGTGLLLLVAGHETTANMTSLSTLALLRTPDQLAALRADPSLVPGAVEELLRYLTVVHSGVPRVAVEDVTVGGVLIRAGEGVLCMISAANRDAAEFAEPDTLDVTRKARGHLAFGFGVHQCLGQPLARVELQVALETLLRRLPGLRLAGDPEEIGYRHDMAVYGVDALPVAW